MKKLTTMATLLALGLLLPASIEAQQVPTANQSQAQSTIRCSSYKSVTDDLKDNYNEGQAAIGLTNTGQVFQIFSTKSGSSWTVLLTSPNGETCLMAAGTGLELIKNLKGIKVSYPTEK